MPQYSGVLQSTCGGKLSVAISRSIKDAHAYTTLAMRQVLRTLEAVKYSTDSRRTLPLYPSATGPQECHSCIPPPRTQTALGMPLIADLCYISIQRTLESGRSETLIEIISNEEKLFFKF